MLRLPRFQLATPATLDEAAHLLRDHGAAEQDPAKTGTPGLRVMLVAGGTDLYPNMKRRQFTPAVVISLRRALGRDIRNGDMPTQVKLRFIHEDPAAGSVTAELERLGKDRAKRK